ncbi:MAG: CDP-alcohol phosphatidyltransferase family protein, partial [Chthoniobacterales bacterium]
MRLPFRHSGGAAQCKRKFPRLHWDFAQARASLLAFLFSPAVENSPPLPPSMTTANKITVVRILMIPAFVTMAIYYAQSTARGEPEEWQRYSAIVIFLIAAVSDGLDGYIARRYNQKSKLGV